MSLCMPFSKTLNMVLRQERQANNRGHGYKHFYSRINIHVVGLDELPEGLSSPVFPWCFPLFSIPDEKRPCRVPRAYMQAKSRGGFDWPGSWNVHNISLFPPPPHQHISDLDLCGREFYLHRFSMSHTGAQWFELPSIRKSSIYVTLFFLFFPPTFNGFRPLLSICVMIQGFLILCPTWKVFLQFEQCGHLFLRLCVYVLFFTIVIQYATVATSCVSFALKIFEQIISQLKMPGLISIQSTWEFHVFSMFRQHQPEPVQLSLDRDPGTCVQRCIHCPQFKIG